MAEAHPVGFQWVMEAKRRGATVIHVDPRFTRTSAVADLHVPIRAGTDIAFLGGADQPRAEQRPATSASTSWPTPTPRRSSTRTSGTPRTSTACSPASTRRPGTYDPTHLARTRTTTRRPRPRDDRLGADDDRERPAAGVARGGAVGGARLRRRARSTGSRRRDETLQHPRCVFQILKRHFARYTPEMVQRGLRHPAGAVRAGRRRADRATRGRERTTRVLLRGRLDPAHASARSTSAPRRSCRRCSATSAAPAAASWRCAGTPASRAPPTSRRCSTCCPATCRCRTRTASRTCDTFVEADDGDKAGFWGNMRAYVVSLLKA